MDLDTLTRFFMWCTILNVALLCVWTLVLLSAPGWVHRLHSRWFTFSRETFDVVIYALLGAFKIVVIVFCIVPWLALLIVGA